MPELIDHIDATVRRKQRAVPYLEFHHGDDAPWRDDANRSAMPAWLYDHGYTWGQCGGIADDVRTIALHRVQQAEMLYEPARRQAGFDIDAYIASGQFGVIAGAPIALRAQFSRAAGEHLYETPLAADQTLSATADGKLLLTASVPNTRALVWWLLGFGDGVVVEQPASLRAELAGIAARMAQAYGT